MGLTLLILSLGHERLWERLPASPYFANAWMVLLSLAIISAGALIAFAMVVAEFALIANTSALTFMVAGTFKEIVTGGWLVGGWVDACGCWVDVAGCSPGTWRGAANINTVLTGNHPSLPLPCPSLPCPLLQWRLRCCSWGRASPG